MPRRARLLAMIMAGGKGDRLQPLTRERSKSAVPFGGRHRLVDFVLSNFMNSDHPSLYVLVQYKSQSLIEHLRLAWRTSGLLPDFFVTVVPPQMRFGTGWYRGTADAVLQNLNLVDDFNADVVAVFGSDHVYRMDVNQMLAFHQEAGADATIAARPVPIGDARQFGVLSVDGAGRVVSFEEKPARPTPLPGDPQRALVSMGNYIFSRQPLVDSLVADPQRAPPGAGGALHRQRHRQRADRRGLSPQARHHPQLDSRPLGVGQRGRGDRGLDRDGSHHRREGRPSPARHRRSLQHHPGRRRDRARRGGRPPGLPRRRVRAGGGAAGRPARILERPRGVLNRAIVIHGHFYQPPRENPWLESVEVQDSAAPHHDWNERVTAECYAPNTAARRVDDKNRVLDIGNNFEKISFNVGPTLISWLERHRPDVYQKILEADRQSVAARGGHGNALAQVYNHMIMPLATRRDKVTQVRWAIEDFRARFGREPEGLWLPETAVDDETLEVLAEADVKFTILAPSQAHRVRPLGAEAWEAIGDGIDPSRAYRWRGARGLSLAVFFYDGPISRGIAFERLLERGEHLVAWLNAAFSDARDWPQLVNCATDGESYGHHFRFGEMALAAAVQQIDAEDTATLTNYGAFLAANPDRKSTCLNSSHRTISYAVFCLKKKKTTNATRYCQRPNSSDPLNVLTIPHPLHRAAHQNHLPLHHRSAQPYDNPQPPEQSLTPH